MPNGQSICCALRDRLRTDPHWQLANLSQPACEILFQHWVVTDRNVLSSLSPNERLTCPLLWCGVNFGDNESLLRHLKDCPQLSSSGYWCPSCHRAESFACTKIPEPIPRSDNRSPACTKIPEPIPRSDNRSSVHKKASRLRKLFCKHFSRKRVTTREDPATKPELFPQELHCNRSMEMNAHGLRYDPIWYTYELDATVETIEDTTKHDNRVLEMNAHGYHHDSGLYSQELDATVETFEDTRNVIAEKDGNSIGKLANGSSFSFSDSRVKLPVQSQQPIAFMQREVADSGANGSSYALISSQFPDRASGQPDSPRYDNGFFSEPENPLHSPANLDSAPRSVQNCVKLTMDPQLSSTTMNVPPQNSPLSASSSQTNTTWSGESTGTALNSVPSFSSSCSPNRVSPRHISKSSSSPLSASSSQTNTTWSGESTGTALNSVASFISSCSQNRVSPRHISKPSAKSARRLRKGKLHCEPCNKIFTDPSNLARHKKCHDGDYTVCRARCGKSFAGARSDNEDRHYTTQRGKELKESDTKLRKLFHRDYAIIKGEVVRCRAGCGVYVTHLDDEAGHFRTQVRKELGGTDKKLDKARPLESIHLDYFLNISDDAGVMGLDS